MTKPGLIYQYTANNDAEWSELDVRNQITKRITKLAKAEGWTEYELVIEAKNGGKHYHVEVLDKTGPEAGSRTS